MRQLIKDYFLSILHKEATEQQIDLWLDHIETAADEAQAIDEMAESLLNQADEVRSILRIYQAVFDRVADSSGLTFWVNNFREILQQNPNLTYKEALVETIRSWFQSDEYVARYGTDPSNEDFLSFLFLNILGRNADQDGYNYWLGRLQDPTDPISREQLVIEFTESDEFKSAVDHEANAILQTAARLVSDDVIDDLDYHIPDGNIHAGELSNEAPIDIISGTDVGENAVAGTPVTGGQLRAVDPDGEEAHVWKLLDDAGGRFVLDDENAQSPRILVADGSKLDYEDAASHQIRVQVADRAGNTFEKVIPIAVNDVNEAPRDLQVSNTEIAEQDGSLSNPGLPETVVAVLGAQDDDSDPLTYSIVASSLPGAFKIVGDLIVVAQPELIDAEAGVETVHLGVISVWRKAVFLVACNHLLFLEPNLKWAANLADFAKNRRVGRDFSIFTAGLGAVWCGGAPLQCAISPIPLTREAHKKGTLRCTAYSREQPLPTSTKRMLPTARRRKTSRILASFWLCMPTNWAWRSISPKCSEPTRYQPKKPIKK